MRIPILTTPNPTLLKTSKEVKSLSTNTIQFIKDLTETLVKKTDPQGVGLSAVQVGTLQRIFLTCLPANKSLPSSMWTPDNMEVNVFINPQIVGKSNDLTLGGKPKNPYLEGCLSIPKVYGAVLRHKWVTVRYTTLDEHDKPIEVEKKFKDFPGRVVQHEYDHLDGILFTDHTVRDNLPLYKETDNGLKPIEV